MKQIDYVYKTDPYDHQHECFMLSRNKRAFALLMEMGTGKSKVIVDTAAYQYNNGRINCLLVFAPNGVHRNWSNIEVPVHLPDYIERTVGYWVAQPRKAERLALERMFTDDPHKMRVVAMNIESLTTKRGKVFIRKLLNTFKVLMCVDESDDIKSAGAARTKSVIALGRYAVMRRICTGTPITQSPLDIYAQYKFLSPMITGFTTKASFNAHFAEYERVELRSGAMNQGGVQKAGRDFYDKLVGYKNLTQLTDLIRPYSYRKKKVDCLDLPEKIYAPPYYVTLSKEQRRLYDDAMNKVVVYLNQQSEFDGTLFDALNDEEALLQHIMNLGTKTEIKNALTRLLRAQQIVGGFFTDEDGTVHPIDEKNKRVEACMKIVNETDSPMIIWSRFIPEIQAISAALREVYGDNEVVEYYGGVSDDEKEEAKLRFQGVRHIVDRKTGKHDMIVIPEEERARFFVGNPAAGGRGLTLTRAQYVVYFSNSFRLMHRLQSEDRAHRIGQKENVTYIDIEAEDTIDKHIRQVLHTKEMLADTVLDPL